MKSQTLTFSNEQAASDAFRMLHNVREDIYQSYRNNETTIDVVASETSWSEGQFGSAQQRLYDAYEIAELIAKKFNATVTRK